MSEDSWIPYAPAQLQGKRLLLLGAHPDDEVAGAGGTAFLARTHAEVVHTWIATDGTRQEGVPAGGEAEYGRMRRGESLAAARCLELPEPEFGGLPDRGLQRLGEELRGEIRSLFGRVRPDLVFCPSPVEIHPDHRALGEALYGVVASSRPEDPDHDLFRFVRLAFYEISQPLLPNALVDVAPSAERKTRALASFASQQRVRDYAGALAGLNAYRRLTLSGQGPVEAFRVVTFQEISARSLEEFRRSIGPALVSAGERGVAPVAVIVRTRNRPALLREALESLAAQTQRPATVVVVNDGGATVAGAVEAFRDAFPIRLEELPQRRGRSAAGNLGLERAGQELAGFLDDDDRDYPDHIERLLAAHRAGPEAVVYSDAATVRYVRDGVGWKEARRTLQYSLDYDPDYLLLANYIPIHTLLAPTALMVRAGGFDEKLDFSEDWDLLIRLSAETSFRHVRGVTCEYRVFDGDENDPAHATAGAEAFQRARREIYERYGARRTEEGVARVIDRLRAQITASYHRDGEARQKLERLRELEALETERARLEAERARLFAVDIRRFPAAGEFGDHVSLLHGEIERLNRLLDQIFASRTWKLHLWLDRLRGRG